MWMTRVSISHPVFATMVMVGAHGARPVFLCAARRRADAGRRPPGVQIWVTYPGASPEQVENDLAKPIESAANTVAGVKRILSRSDEGRSLTWVEFRYEVDMNRAIQEVRDKLAQIRAGFPRDVKDPVVTRAGGENDQPVASFALIGKDSCAARTDAAGRAGGAERLRARQGCRPRRPRRQCDAPDPGPRRSGQADRVRPVG